MILVNGIENGALDALDRGLAYGDGVFRTFQARGGKALLWQRHYAKLAADCAALSMACPASEVLERDLAETTAREPDCVVKIIVTRGCGQRGYALPGTVSPTRIVSTSPLPDYPPDNCTYGVRVHQCSLRLSFQPRLAGIKHLNRLENVLARSEWSDAAIAEGLLCDAEENVVGGTMTNLFLVKHGTLLTPDLTRCGVAGVTRALVIELARGNGIPVRIAAVSIDDLHGADEIFLVNSVIGIWPVAALARKTWDAGQLTAHIRQWLANAQNP